MDYGLMKAGRPPLQKTYSVHFILAASMSSFHVTQWEVRGKTRPDRLDLYDIYCQMFRTLGYSDDELVEYWYKTSGLDLEEEEIESEDSYGFEVDQDGFDSLSDDENDPPLKSTLKKLRKKNAKAIQESGCPFYLGQSILEKKQIKKLVTAYAVKTRRQLYVLKNDKFRFKVICMGKHLHSCVIGPDETKNLSEGEKGFDGLSDGEIYGAL
ncbi:hypothetical protein QVD17_37913 [Tagetes erecta]|uniref:Uncharacterized protein n=1 Tax=Tagetes erecta TaxID=13708 RepID=A0AAD8JUW0_TARER|nr:hypothetical protein QVD17_37913 [Tagetes erecta]